MDVGMDPFEGRYVLVSIKQSACCSERHLERQLTDAYSFWIASAIRDPPSDDKSLHTSLKYLSTSSLLCLRGPILRTLGLTAPDTALLLIDQIGKARQVFDLVV